METSSTLQTVRNSEEEAFTRFNNTLVQNTKAVTNTGGIVRNTAMIIIALHNAQIQNFS